MKYDIFISYRRNGGYETAKHLFDLLRHDGYMVSFDIDTLRNGDFDKELLKRINECQDFILILNKGVFDRCINQAVDISHDWLRNELAYAIMRGKNIIPIMLADFDGFPENLPADISRVAYKNGPIYNLNYFDEFYAKMKKDFLSVKPQRNIELEESLSKLNNQLLILTKNETEDSITQKGEILHKMAIINNTHGDIFEALSNYRSSIVEYEKLQAINPQKYKNKLIDITTEYAEKKGSMTKQIKYVVPIILVTSIFPIATLALLVYSAITLNFISVGVSLLLLICYTIFVIKANKE